MGLAPMGYSTESTDPDESNAATLLYNTIGAMIAGVLVTLLSKHRATPWTPVMRDLPLALSLRRRGIAQSSLQKRHQVRRARVRRHTAFDNLAPLAEYSADILVPLFLSQAFPAELQLRSSDVTVVLRLSASASTHPRPLPGYCSRG